MAELSMDLRMLDIRRKVIFPSLSKHVKVVK